MKRLSIAHSLSFFGFLALFVANGSAVAATGDVQPFPLFGNDVAQVQDVSLAQVPEPIMPAEKAMPSDAVFNPEDQVDLLADMLEHNETGQIVTARGNVELVQAGRILRADQISYNLAVDVVKASGNVVLNDEAGDTYFADNFELSQKMKEGFVRGLHGLLADGSRFTAVEGEQAQGGAKMIMSEATYTPCEPCKNNPDKVIWQLKADKVIHHKDEQRISYEDATFELGGVPIMYVPYFSHPDGSVKRKSGFLTPRIGFDSELGTTFRQEYYWDIAPNQDATVGVITASKKAPVLLGEYRHRFEKAFIQAEGSTTYSDYFDSVSGVTVQQDKAWRGHLFSEGIWDINDKWRAGLNLEITSDDQYLRQYNITNKDILENNLYLERFSDRDYALARISAFQDIRVSSRQADQPNILPEIHSRFLGDPGGILGGRWSLEASALGLGRDGGGQDLNRASLEAGWQRRYVSGLGLASTLDLITRGDVYNVNDRDIADIDASRSESASEVRGFVKGNFKTAYPIQKRFERMQWLVEPMVSVTSASNVDVSNNIPNEDSQDVFIDPMTLFNVDRFPGYDRIEDRSRATYGIRTGLFGYEGYRGEIFFGQSYRFDSGDNPFPVGSGLSEDKSDYVGQISTSMGGNLDLDYRFQLDENNYSSKRHEVDFVGRAGPVTATTRYFYAAGLGGTDLTDSREQIRTGLRYQLDDQWSFSGSVQYDFADKNKGIRNATSGFEYSGQCLTFGLTGQRTYTSAASGDSDTSIIARIGLKNLGEFQTSGITIASSNSENDASVNEAETAVTP